MELKEIIEYHIKRKGYNSFRQFSIDLGVDYTAFLRSVGNPSYKTLTRISEKLDIEPWELLKPPGNDGVDYKPETRPGKKVERILFEYSDGSCDRFVKDPEPFED